MGIFCLSSPIVDRSTENYGIERYKTGFRPEYTLFPAASAGYTSQRGFKYPKVQILAQIASSFRDGYENFFKDGVIPNNIKEVVDRLTSNMRPKVIKAMSASSAWARQSRL
jgi:hypothetical protein